MRVVQFLWLITPCSLIGYFRKRPLQRSGQPLTTCRVPSTWLTRQIIVSCPPDSMYLPLGWNACTKSVPNLPRSRQRDGHHCKNWLRMSFPAQYRCAWLLLVPRVQ